MSAVPDHRLPTLNKRGRPEGGLRDRAANAPYGLRALGNEGELLGVPNRLDGVDVTNLLPTYPSPGH